MGFRPPMATHKLEWPEGHHLHGLEVKVRSVSVDEYNVIMRLLLDPARSGDDLTAGTRETDNELLRRLSAGLNPAEQAQLTRLSRASDEGGNLVAANDQLLAKLADNLVSWNYEDPATGEPLAADRAGIGRADSTHMTAIIQAWTTALVSVPPPLQRPSANGSLRSDSAESALQLANLSASQSN